MALLPTATSASVSRESGTFGGEELTYRVILPEGYDPERTYPTVLTFPGGGQSWGIVENMTENDWRDHAESRGFIVISPAAPDAGLFFRGGDRVFPEFLDYILETWPVENDRLHVAGVSNGGLSAFHVASHYPQYFMSVTGYPGLLNDATQDRLDALRPLCIYMHVGERDASWRRAMERQFQSLRSAGFEVSFAVEDNQDHVLDTSRADLGNRLFDQLAVARAGCD